MGGLNQALPVGIPGAERVAHGWLSDGSGLRLLAETRIDIDAMPPHETYAVFGERRETMGPGPVRVVMALAAAPDGRIGVARSWRLSSAPPWDAGELADMVSAARPGRLTGQSVNAPFTTPVGALSLCGILEGEVPYAERTRELVREEAGEWAARAYDASLREARYALAGVIGSGALERLGRMAAMGWLPKQAHGRLLSSELPPAICDAAVEAGYTWPFLRTALPEVAADAPGTTASPLDLAVAALGRRGSRAHLRRIAPVGHRLTRNAMGVLTQLPVDWLPQDGADPGWEPLLAVAQAAGDITSLAGVEAGHLLRDAKGRWDAYAARIARMALPDAESPTVGQALGHAADMVHAFEHRLLAPALALADAGPRVRVGYRDALRLMLGQAALGAFAERVGTYGARREPMQARLRETSPHVCADLAWDPHLPEWVHPGTGVTVSPLGDEESLRREGAARNDASGAAGLSHCVGDYGMACADGRSRILSLRIPGRDGYARLSTAEIRWPGDGGAPVVSQHAGRGNGEPGRQASAALSAYMGHLSSLGTGRPAPVHRPEMPHGARQAGYDTSVRANVETALRLWRPILPRPLRAEGLEAFAGAVARQLAGETARRAREAARRPHGPGNAEARAMARAPERARSYARHPLPS